MPKRDMDEGHGENDHDGDDGYYINIKKENRGLFTKYCKGLGHIGVTDSCIAKAKASGNPELKKQAVFAENARGWAKKHKEEKAMAKG